MFKIRVAAVLGSLTFALALVAMPEASASPTTVHDELVESMKRACDATCDTECLLSSEHRVASGGGNATKGYGTHGCSASSLTCDYHSCNQTSIDPGVDLYRMVAGGDIREVVGSVGEMNREYVPERQVLQILSDCGNVVAQLPVASTEARALLLE